MAGSIFAFVVSIAAIVYAFLLFTDIMQKPDGDEAMRKIAGYIQTGAKAFLVTQYKILVIFVIVVAGSLTALGEPRTAIAFATGGFFSALSGYFGMHCSTRSAVRTTEAAKTGLGPALTIAFQSGMVMGLTVVGLATVGICIFYWLNPDDVNVLFGYSFGASSIALFARVGGGIYTKAADVGADLVGKVEAGIPEDDPRNPAVIADNVGDNVGDVAGMGADLFESYVGAIISSMVLAVLHLGAQKLDVRENVMFVVLPLILAGIGTLGSMIGRKFVYTEDEKQLGSAIFKGVIVASAIFGVGAFGACYLVPAAALKFGASSYSWIGVYGAVMSGLVIGVAIGKITEMYTTTEGKSVQEIAKSSVMGSATNIIQGLAVGMKSCWMPLILIAVASMLAYRWAGVYGVALSAVGMLSTLGITLGVDAYGPVADNAGGIAEMTHQPKEVRSRTDSLDAAGNTTAAIGKGFAIGSAALTALALFQSYLETTKLDPAALSIGSVNVVAGILIGGMLPFLFASMAMLAVGRAAGAMIEEVRRQFRENPGVMAGTQEPDYARCVSISTKGAIREMILPGLLAVIAPILIGLTLGLEALGGLLAGSTVTGVVLAIFMANAGGAWDNAKKYIEAGNLGGKGGDAHKAAVVGDTVGDPFKDTAGPSINILIKLMAVVSIIAAPMIMKLAS